MEALLIQLVSGSIGSAITGRVFKKISFSILNNFLLGIVGGGLSGQILSAGVNVINISAIFNSIISGLIGGIILILLAEIIKKTL